MKVNYMNNQSTKPIYIVFGRIIKGKGIGTLAGFPTANMSTEDLESLPPNGVYVSALSWNGELYQGVTNVGNRPTVDDDKEISIETHLIDFYENIYGEYVELRLFKKIREIRKFETLKDLAEQIEKDKTSVKIFFKLFKNIAQENKY